MTCICARLFIPDLTSSRKFVTSTSAIMSLQSTHLEPHQSESIHLFKVIHSSTVPELSQEYLKTWGEHNLTHDVIYPPALSYKTCTQCGVLLVAGLNVTIRIRYESKRRLQFRCHNCRHANNDETIVKEDSTMTSVTSKIKVEGDANKITKPTATSKAKQRAKRRKGGLGALLEQKKHETQLNGLNLMEFMK